MLLIYCFTYKYRTLSKEQFKNNPEKKLSFTYRFQASLLSIPEHQYVHFKHDDFGIFNSLI